MYDIIGDIHGYAKTLEAMLRKLDYSNEHGVFKHKDRKVIFVGDFIDRGPSIRESLQIVKPMVESGSALAVMGNHEYNAICYHSPTKDGKGWLRERSPKNIKQHSATMAAFANFYAEWPEYLEWFKSLPLFLELGKLRIVHAFWDNKMIDLLCNKLGGNQLKMEFLYQSSQKGSQEYHWIENILKGYELTLPGGIKYVDKDGYERAEIRVQWWKQLNNETYKSISVNANTNMPEVSVIPSDLARIPVYPHNETPVFIGHYWNTGKPSLLSHNVCCVDYSVARGQKLVTYRWNGEPKLNADNFVQQENLDI